MTVRRDPEVLLAAWLDENAVPLPSETRHAIETSIRTIPQRRRPMWLPWRSLPMTSPLRIAATAAIVVVVAIGALLYFRPTAVPGVGTPSPTPTAAAPSAAASALDPATWTDYTAAEYGFSVKHPSDWQAFPETNRLFFSGGATWGTGISVARYEQRDGHEPQIWLVEHCGRAFSFAAERPDDSEGIVPCELKNGAAWADTRVDTWRAFTGSSADNCCRDTVAFTDGYVYVITGWHNAAYDSALYDAFVASLKLDP